MKKLILPLLLLVAFGMLAAVESDPSNVVGYVKYPCVFGDNFVAMPMVDGATIVSEFALPYNGSDDINTVQLWDPVGQGWAACTNYGGNFFDPDLPVGPGTPCFLTPTRLLTITVSATFLQRTPSTQSCLVTIL